MNHDWNVRFLELAKHIATWSKDPSTQVGAVIVNDQKIVVGMGFNGFPRGCDDNPSLYTNREVKYSRVVHAEINAILQAGNNAVGATIYIWPSFSLPPVCAECCKVIIQAGIKHIVGCRPDENDPRVQRWKNSIEFSAQMCKEAGVTWEAIELGLLNYDYIEKDS